MEAAAAVLRQAGDLKGPDLVVTALVGALTLIGVLFFQCWQPYLLRLEERLERDAQQEQSRLEMAAARAADSQAVQWRTAEDIGLTPRMLHRVESALGAERVRGIMRRHLVKRRRHGADGRAGPSTDLDSIPWYRLVAACGECLDEHARHLCCQAIGTKPRLSSHLRPAHTSGWSAEVRQEYHTGELQLITWGMVEAADDSDGSGELVQLGWGGVPVSEVPEAQRVFRDDCEGSLPLFHDARPTAFRWTCCGLRGDAVHGCEHHGPGCSCDYCRGGCPAPYVPTQANRFLRLANSPASAWQLAAGLPHWTPDVHVNMPHSFQAQTRVLLLCWLRTPLPMNIVLLVLRHLFAAEAAEAQLWEAHGNGRGRDPQSSSQLRQELERLRQEARDEEEYEKQNDVLLQELLSVMREVEGSAV
jgi:hypothetical protein